MKVGFILECGPQGAETKVIPHLARLVNPAIVPDPMPLDSKRKLRGECGESAKGLLASGCRRVIIVWDLLSDWDEYEGKGCRHNDKEEIAKSLEKAGIQRNDTRVRVVCIEKMLEAWLMADEKALNALLSTVAHPTAVPRQKNPEGVRNPKLALNSLFRKSGSRINRYDDLTHAFKIALRIDLTRLRKLSSFQHFERQLP